METFGNAESGRRSPIRDLPLKDIDFDEHDLVPKYGSLGIRAMLFSPSWFSINMWVDPYVLL